MNPEEEYKKDISELRDLLCKRAVELRKMLLEITFDEGRVPTNAERIKVDLLTREIKNLKHLFITPRDSHILDGKKDELEKIFNS